MNQSVRRTLTAAVPPHARVTPVTLRQLSRLDRVRFRFRMALRRLGWFQAPAVPVATHTPRVYCNPTLPADWKAVQS